jgi:hypothetical protein
MGEIKLTSPRLRVIRDGHDPLEMQTTNPDLILWERTSAKHKWPDFQKAPVTWMTFISWAAARRTGAIPVDMTYEKWEAETLDVTPVSDDDGDESVNPIPAGPEFD